MHELISIECTTRHWDFNEEHAGDFVTCMAPNALMIWVYAFFTNSDLRPIDPMP